MKTLQQNTFKWLIMLAFVLISAKPAAQNVTVSLNILPPYSPYFKDYTGYMNQKTVVTLHYINPASAVPLKVYLLASIRKDDNSISAEVRDTYRPAIPIDLLPNIPKTLTGIQLREIFGSSSTSDVIINGINTNDLITNQALPEGNYSICVKVREYNTRNLITEDCRNMYIAYSEPPQILTPINNSTEIQKIPQYVNISWTPVTPFTQGTTYRLRVVKLLPGVSLHDALNYSTQVVLEKSNIPTTNFPLDLASGIKLEPGVVYAVQVTGLNPFAYIKNNGRSEPVQFMYTALKAFDKPDIDDSNFTFLNPRAMGKKPDTLSVNNENNLLMNWCWVKNITSDSAIVNDDEMVEKLGINQYVLSINPKKTVSGKEFKFTKVFTLASPGVMPNKLELTDTEALDAGFVDGELYSAIINIYDKENKLIKSVNSPDFIFRRMADEAPIVKIPVRAVLRYKFTRFPESYPINNSQITIEALKAKNSGTAANFKTHTGSNLFDNLPPEIIRGRSYVKIASEVATTDTLGLITTTLKVPEKYFDTDSVCLRIRISNKYYIDKHFGTVSIPVSKKDTSINFGQLTAFTYGYSLRLNVKKQFTSYQLTRDDDGLTVQVAEGENVMLTANNTAENEYQNYVYNVQKSAMASGIPVVLYRKNKPAEVPYFEGDIKTSVPQNKLSDITIVALGTTQRIKDSTLVIFDRLLATDFQGEEYNIIAIKNLDDLIKTQKLAENISENSVVYTNFSTSKTGLSADMNHAVSMAIQNLNTGGNTTNFIDSAEFIAETMPFRLPLPPAGSGEQSYYRTAKADYSIISCKPPTSVIRGRLFYTWKSDPSKIKRPLANTHFRVMVDYVDGKNNQSIGSVTNTSEVLSKIAQGGWEYTVFKPDNSDEVVPLVDQYATMAEGTTDSEGNFVLEVVNLNEKGSLGSGTVHTTSGGSKPPVAGQSMEQEFNNIGQEIINPWDQMGNNFGTDVNQWNSHQKTGMQNSVNGGAFNIEFDAGTNSFELGGVKTKTGGAAAGGMQFAPLEDFEHGPNPSTPAALPQTENKAVDYTDFRRLFRIVVDGSNAAYYYPSADLIKIQPFENMTTPQNVSVYVRELRLKAKTYDEADNPLTEMQVTVFRGADKPVKLPLGEGDNKYTFKELISPEYDLAKTEVEMNADAYTGGFNYAQKFEQLWPSQQVNNQSTVILPALLQAQNTNYFVQSSSFVNQGSKTYKATINEIPVFEDKTLNWSDPQIPEAELKIKLQPLLSRALVRVKDSVSKQNLTTDVKTRVLISKSPLNVTGNTVSGSYLTKYVDKYGYAVLTTNSYPLKEYVKTQNDDAHQVNIYFYAKAEGYGFGGGQYKFPYSYKGKQASPVLTLYPTGKFKGKVVNADASAGTGGGLQLNTSLLSGVPAYIQADSGKIFETDAYGNFEIPLAPFAGTKLKITPKDVAWFDTTLVITQADANKQLINAGKIKVYRRKHRIQFTVQQKMPTVFTGPPTPVAGATIQLGNTIVKTASNGTAKFSFENVSVNNYTFVVRGPQAQGYIPITKNMESNETREFVNVNIVLEKGSEISGTVKLDGKAVKNARVYLEVSNTETQTPVVNYTGTGVGANSGSTGASVQSGSQIAGNAMNLATQPSGSIDGDANLLIAYTDALGKFKLQGVPVNNQKIQVIATLDTTFTVSGDKQTADIKSGVASVNLNLNSFTGAIINKLYGFPLTVEKITAVNANQVRVTGLVHWTEALSDFTPQEVTKVLRVEDVRFNLVKKNNVVTAVAHENTVNIPGVTSLKLSYTGKYNVKLTSPQVQGAYNTIPLSIVRSEDTGKIAGKIQIVDNSFNYPGSYLSFTGSEFYLAKLNADSSINNIVNVAASAFTESESLSLNYQQAEIYRTGISNKIATYNQQPKPVYQLCDNTGKAVAFKLINFGATANPKKSYIDEAGKIHLNVDLNCHIPNAQPENFKLNIPDLVLDQNKVYPATSAKPLQVSLEEWTLEVRNWQFSTTEGGIVSNDALIRTKILDIPVEKFVLRNDMFIMDEFKMDKLAMAGGRFPLLGVDKKKAALVYEYKAGTDLKPHWNFCLLGGGNTKVASLPSLKGLHNYTIDLNYIEILSNNEMIVQLMQKSNKALLMENTLARFEPLSIFNGPDYINVTGLLNTGAPRMSDIDLTARWTNKDSNPAFENVSVDMSAKGFVHFEAAKQKITIDKQLLTIEGRVTEKPEATFNPLPAKFYARTNALPRYEVMLQPDWVTQLNQKEPDNITTPVSASEGYNLKIISGGMHVASNDWTTLKYEGWMRANTAADDNMADSKARFEVLGDISVKSDELAVTGINTPLGSMSQVFDFKRKELIGELTIKSEVLLGTVRLYSGIIQTCFGAEGFYVSGGCYAFIPAGILSGDYNVGFMAGSYKLTDELWNVTNTHIDERVRNLCYKQNTSKLSGFYFAFNREIINKSIDFDFILASGYVKALALIGGDFYINAGTDWKVGADGYVHVNASAGLSAITGTSLTGSSHGTGRIMFQIGNPSYFKLNTDLGFNASITQDLGVKTVSKSVSVNCYAEGGTDGFKFQTGSGGAKLGCNTTAENTNE